MLNLSKKSILVTVLAALTWSTSANATPNQPVQINVNNNIERFTVDPNNGYVVFNEFDSAGGLQRYTTQIDGQSQPIQIGTNINETFNGVDFSIFSGNSRILSRLENPITGDRDFLSVSIDGNDSTLLRPASPITGNVSASSRSRNNILSFIIVGGGLFSVPNDGSAPAIDLSSSIDINSNIDVGRIRGTQDGSTIVFDAEIDAIREQALFSVPVNGNSNPTRLTPLNDTIVRNFSISEDQSTVIYVEESGPGVDLREQQLFSVPIDGSSEPIALTNLIVGNNFSDIDFEISPDTSHVVFSIENFSSGVTQLFSVATNGQTSAVLIDEGLEVHQVEITNDNRFIIYSITQTLFGNLLSDDVPVLYRAELTSTPNDEPIILSFVNDNPFDIFILSGPSENPINTNIDFVITQDSNFVFFVQNLPTFSFGDGNSLSRASISNPADMPSTIVSSNQSNSISLGPALSLILDFKLSNDETFITYLFETTMPFGSNSTLPPHQLSKVDINGSNNQLLPTSSLGDVSEFEISNNDEYVIFTAGFQPGEEDNNNNLYSLSLSKTIVEPLCFPIKAKNDNFVTICL